MEEYDELREVVMKRGEQGPFDANEILSAYIEHRIATRGGTIGGYNAHPVNAGSVAQILRDWGEAGLLRPLGGNPPRWELAQREK